MIKFVIQTYTAIICFVMLFFSSCQRTVILQFSTGGELQQHEKEIIREFEEKNPHIKIRPVKLPAFSMSQHDSYVTYLSGGEGSVDVFAIDVIWLAEFAESGWIAPLDEYFNPTERDIYLPMLLKAGIYNNKLYGIPGVADIGLLYLNTKLLAGWPDKEPAASSWEAIFSVRTPSRSYPLALQAAASESLICNLLEFFPAEVDLKDDLLESLTTQQTAWLAALERYKKAVLLTKGLALSQAENESGRLFLENKAVFLRNWPYFLGLLREQKKKLNEDFRIYPLPERPTIGGWYLVINRNSPYKEEAALFLKYITGEEVQRRNLTERYARGESAGLPSATALYRDTKLQQDFPELKMILLSLEKARARFISPDYYEHSRLLVREVHSYLKSRHSAAETIKKISAQLKAIQ